MNAIIAALGGKIGLALVSAAGIGLVIKLGRPPLKRAIGNGLAHLLSPNAQDPKEKELLADIARACIRYAEYKIPDRGAGTDKLALATKLLTPYLPGASVEAVSRLVQEVFDTLDDELKARL